MMRCPAVVLLAMILIAPAARAEGDCEGTTQAEMNLCAGNEFEAADKALNDRYASLMKQLDPEAQAHLRNAQRAWISYRDRMCEFEVTGLGSARPMVFAGCLTKLTQEQIKLLDYHLTCEEGDLSCNRSFNR